MGIRNQIRRTIYEALRDDVTDYTGEAITDTNGETIYRTTRIVGTVPEVVVDANGSVITDANNADVFAYEVSQAAIYDVAPQVDDSALPFLHVVIGTQITRPMDTKTSRGVSTLVRLFTYSRNNSAQEIENAQDAIYDVLHYQKYQIGNADVINIRRDGSDILPGPEGRFYGVDEYLIETTKI